MLIKTLILIAPVSVLQSDPAASVFRPSFSSGGGSIGSTTRGLHALRPVEDEGSNVIAVKPGNLTCFTCQLDFRKKQYETNHPCLGRHDGLNVSDDFLVSCGPKDIYCRAERTEVNGILVTLIRECSSVCYYGCRPKGFGISYETCAECCTSHACNDMYPESGAQSQSLSYNLLFFMCTGFFLRINRVGFL